MSQSETRYQARDADDVRERIAEVLGYCTRDGGLHDPSRYDKKLLRSRWRCPECGHTIGLEAYQRASELRWALEEVKFPEEEGAREVDVEAINRELGIDDDVEENIMQIKKIMDEDDA